MDLTHCSLNSITVRSASLPELVALAAAHGFGGIGLWRDSYTGIGAAQAARHARTADLRVTSVCRGGMFPQPTAEQRARTHDDNLRAIDEAHTLGADCLVLVCGPAHDRDQAGARAQIADGIAALLDHAGGAGVRLAIEPMHPMMAADRSAITSLGEAVDLVERFASPWVGLTVDTYHVWWDIALPDLLKRAADSLYSVQLADWVLPIQGQLSSRGMPGDGHIDMPGFVELTRSVGYGGMIEVEVLSDRWWATPPADVAQAAAEALRQIPERAGQQPDPETPAESC
ncbi:sugar phosphate isomerase/epimerase family protein [Streptomyces sp. TG1A-8]|uniref:sugar phosphate isomerase/epimerase family protein n=1 Tax=Streptomyces sp. TG1A-8 TaxID=3051385 RepID=UPI00265BED7D|nr:sugar phosphate isomerase/epimerase family protein [Streptomyces sp. TG1A-8]MDO0929589.1 sugar phosphate isomerase/epimerase family protein [Streptomyces sp. TG1A-8]